MHLLNLVSQRSGCIRFVDPFIKWSDSLNQRHRRVYFQILINCILPLKSCVLQSRYASLVQRKTRPRATRRPSTWLGHLRLEREREKKRVYERLNKQCAMQFKCHTRGLFVLCFLQSNILMITDIFSGMICM